MTVEVEVNGRGYIFPVKMPFVQAARGNADRGPKRKRNACQQIAMNNQLMARLTASSGREARPDFGRTFPIGVAEDESRSYRAA